VIRAEEQRDVQNEARALDTLARPLNALEDHLDGLPFLLGEQFSVADLNLASVLTLMNRANFDLRAYPEIKRWRESCYDRPSYRKIYPG
jgi:glutathione S-transferase